MSPDTNGGAEEITVEVDENHGQWLQITAREYGMSAEEVANELLRYGLVHHEEAFER